VADEPAPELEVLDALAEVLATFRELAVRLTSRDEVDDVLVSVELRPGPLVEFMWDAVLDNDEALSWQLSAQHDGRWTIATGLWRNHVDGGHDSVIVLPLRSATSAHDFAAEIIAAAEQLTSIGVDEPTLRDFGARA
jgi:hypothetical protein